jgi:hypothetical protein
MNTIGLLDIAPIGEKVKLSEDQEILVTGISLESMVDLILRFPDVGKWFAGGKLGAENFLKTGPAAVAAAIAAGTGAGADPRAEEIARRLPIETQVDILEAIARVSFREGFGPFVARVLNLAGAARTPGKAPDTISPQASTPSSGPDTPAESVGK